MEGGRGVPDDEVEGDEEAAKDDTEGAADDGEENILLEHYSIPRRPAASVIYVSRHDRRTWGVGRGRTLVGWGVGRKGAWRQ